MGIESIQRLTVMGREIGFDPALVRLCRRRKNGFPMFRPWPSMSPEDAI